MQTNTTFTLVTGATSGIEYELAKLFGSMGHNLIIVARSAEELEKKQRELSTLHVDVIPIPKVISGTQNKTRTAIGNLVKSVLRKAARIHGPRNVQYDGVE